MYRDKLKSLLEKICPVSACEAWDSFKISLFWSCPVITRDEWIAGLTQNSHASSGMLRDSLTYINIRSFFDHFPLEIFYNQWAAMRLYCPRNLFKRRNLFDMAWSVLATGTPLVPPLKTWFALPQIRKKIVAEVSRRLCMERKELIIQFNDEDCSTLSELEKMGFLRVFGDKVLTGIKHRTLQNPHPAKNGYFIVKNMPGRIFRPRSDGSY